MTDTATTPDTASRDTVRQVAVFLSTIIAVVVSFLGSGAVVGTPVSEVANGVLDTDATLVAPGGPAFAIWGVIYTGLLLLAINQAMPWRRADARQRRAGWWIVASALLNAAWIVTVQLELLVISVILIGALVGVLVVALLRLNEGPASTAYERLVVDGTLGLYLGWACIATVANSAAAALDAGMAPAASTATTWAIAVLVVAAGIGVLLAIGLGGRIAPAIGLAWGLGWVAAERAGGLPQSDAVAVSAAIAAAITLIAAIVVRANVHRRSPAA
jgi:hypothetical protein